jgi:hypothetical protein
MIALAVVLAVSNAPGPGAGHAHVSRTDDFSNLTAYRARQLQGRLARYHVRLGEDRDLLRDDFDTSECAGEGEPIRSLWLPLGQEVADELTVEAVLAVIPPKRWVTPTGQRFPAFSSSA